MLKLTKRQLLERLEDGFTDSIFYPEVVLRDRPNGGRIVLSARLNHKQFPHDFANVSELKKMTPTQRFELLVDKVLRSSQVFPIRGSFFVLSEEEMEYRTLSAIDMDDIFSGKIQIADFNRDFADWRRKVK